MSTHDYKVMVKALKKDLRGHYAEIAARSGFHLSTVSKVLDGKFENDQILNVAIEVRDEVRLKQEQRLNKLSKAISS